MEHNDAIRSRFAERYLLGDLSAAEADAFEDHYFDCRVCASDVREGMILLDTGRELVRSERAAESTRTTTAAAVVRPHRSRWNAWVPAAAAAALVLAVGLPMMRQRQAPLPPQPTISVVQTLELDTARGEDAAGAVAYPAGTRILVPVEILSERAYERYEVSVRGAQTNLAVPVALDAQGQPKSVVLDALPAGTYTVAIEGVERGNRVPISTRSFRVR
ncbi:MAG: hypothetical protein ACLGH0_13840 [Thermoanaerobaculia bacterium]